MYKILKWLTFIEDPFKIWIIIKLGDIVLNEKIVDFAVIWLQHKEPKY